jgi:protein-S-isoprenylcysteine O-methyltransferase Ste14
MNTFRMIFLIIGATGLILPAAMDFIINRHGSRIVARENTLIKAFSILGYFIIIILLASGSFGTVAVTGPAALAIEIAGAVIILASAFLNCIGRYQLGKFWSDDIVVFESHHLITTGVFGHMRHPLFTSLIGLSLGISLLFTNYAVLSGTIILLFPAVFVRARREENMLTRFLPEYKEYKKHVPMFFPTGRR